jgi:N-acetyl-gamma-glutamyl-phosphate reductase/acetylglutamate kinase
MPDVREHEERFAHGVTVGGFALDAASGRLALVSCVDNLLKGAATQCVQNLNLALGFDELEGIPL